MYRRNRVPKLPSFPSLISSQMIDSSVRLAVTAAGDVAVVVVPGTAPVCCSRRLSPKQSGSVRPGPARSGGGSGGRGGGDGAGSGGSAL